MRRIAKADSASGRGLSLRRRLGISLLLLGWAGCLGAALSLSPGPWRQLLAGGLLFALGLGVGRVARRSGAGSAGPTPAVGREAIAPLLGSAVEQTGDTVVLTDPRGRIRWVNRAFEQVTGYRLDEVVGRNPSLLKSGRQDRDHYRRMWSALLAGSTWRGHFFNRRKDGSEYELEQTIAPVRDEEGRLQGFLAVGRDLTTESSLRAQLLQAQKMEAIGRLAGGVAHDFNNLLAVILSYAGFVVGDTEAGSQVNEDAREVEKAARRAAELTRRLLLLSRKESVDPERLDVGEVVQDLARMLQRILGEDVELAVACAREPWQVEADRTQLEQVLMNLAVNARDAMEGGGLLRLSVENHHLDEEGAAARDLPPGRWVRLAVEDQGSGMSREVVEQAFDPFFTTKARGKGTGLGLATVRGIVHGAGGRVRLDSEPGRGTTVEVFLPVAEASPVAELGGEAPLARLQGDETLLLVEDDAAVRGTLRRMLLRQGYEVIAASRCDEARQLAEARPDFALLLCDVALPDGSGTRLAAELGERRQVPVIFVTGHSDELLVAAEVDADRVDLLRKPFGERELLRRVRSRLDGTQAARSVA